MEPREAEQARERLEELSSRWSEVAPTTLLRKRAERLLRLHPLRAADALHLAAALLATGEDPAGSLFHVADVRLGEAARREGFTVPAGGAG